MPVAEIIAIGTELLLGEIQDTNTCYLARLLRNVGIDIYRTTIVGDNKERVAQAIREAMTRADIVITTGGLGPTVDDPARDAVALAVGVHTEFIDELWEQIQERFQRYHRTPTENNKRQAYIPSGAIPVENPVGTAPAFIVDTKTDVIISLPGVPREMEYLSINSMIPFLKDRFNLKGLIKARVLHTAGIGESQVDELIGDLETCSNPTVGLLAHPGQVDIRITAKAESESEVDRLIHEMEKTIRDRLGQNIFGVDQDTLISIVFKRLAKMDRSVLLMHHGIEFKLPELERAGGTKIEAAETSKQDTVEIKDHFKDRLASDPGFIGASAVLYHTDTFPQLQLLIVSSDHDIEKTGSYGGPPAMAPLWGQNTFLNLLRLTFFANE